MKKLLKVLTLLLMLLCWHGTAHSQVIKNLGLTVNYNYGVKNAGVGLRYYVALTEKLSIVPQVRYQPAFNTIHEAYAGLMLHYSIYENNSLGIYALAGGEVNYWLNYAPTVNPKAKEVNALPELGAGIQIPLNKFIIFTELKYNPIWNEAFSELGIRLTPNKRRKNKQLKCPKFI
ncbi:hypothetical protein [uncultured Arcticibacterium sp.]|uniref:hypothetical protein n=1 Tax=uncultured Arcticibacterium sp. TaxID=2173042 RepID=UPI0030F5E384